MKRLRIAFLIVFSFLVFSACGEPQSTVNLEKSAMEYILYHVIYGEVGQVEMISEDTEDGLFDELVEE